MEPRYIQSCVTSIGFPEFLPDALEMLAKNAGYTPGRTFTDLEVITGFASLENRFAEWTAARWMTEGDVLFFYHTNRGHKSIRRLLKEARQWASAGGFLGAETVEMLERNLELSSRVESCIFACAPVKGSASYYDKEEWEHFGGRSFVPFEEVHVFENPLHSKDFGEHFKIGQNTVTPLYKRNFGAIRDLLARDNRIPDYLQSVEIGDVVFQNIKPERNNWREIVSSPQVRFLNEAQVREYFIDYLLDDIRDPRTPILEECETWRGREKTGRADYFVMIGGRWVPVEAKLNILTERDLLGQVGQYLQIDRFKPTMRARMGQVFNPEPHDACIVMDQSGLYLTHDRRFVDCDFGSPCSDATA